MYRHFGAIILNTLLVIGLATTKLHAAPDARLLALRDLDRTVAVLGFKLATSNLDICQQREMWSGLLLHDLNQYISAMRPAAAETFKFIGTAPAILAIVPKSPADTGDMKEDDTILSINGQSLVDNPEIRKADDQSINRAKTLFENALNAGKADLIVSTNGRTHLVTLTGTPGCASRTELVPGSSLNAAADGHVVQISGALVEFMKNDDELAIIIAHEMAHNILGHADKLEAAGVHHGIFSQFGKNALEIKRTEVEADYLGLYLATRAGFDILAGINFWQRYGKRTGGDIFQSPTHPTWQARQAIIRHTIAEIEQKRQSDTPLLPDLPQHIP